jgi:VirK protein
MIPLSCVVATTITFLGTTTLPVAKADAGPPGPGYEEVLEALKTGLNVEILTNPAHCIDIRSGKASRFAPAGLEISEFLITAHRGVSFSYAHETLDADGGISFEDVRYNLGLDDKVSVTVRVRTHSGVAQESRMSCRIPDGAHFVW